MTIGKAYGFFACEAPLEDVEAELLNGRELLGTPSQLELALFDGVGKLNTAGDDKLKAVVEEAKGNGMRYVIEATYPQATNKTTAGELSDILNQASLSPLYKKKVDYFGAVVYKTENNDYLFWE